MKNERKYGPPGKMLNNDKAIILLSGGLDSTTCLAIAKKNGYDCYTLSFDYGQKHRVELTASQKIADYFNVTQHEVISLSIGNLGGSALTDKTIDVPDYVATKSIPITYVPARNTVFLSIALGYAEILDADAIYIGVNSTDYSGYPDCRAEYIAAFQNLATLATKKGVSGGTIHIKTPLMHLTKADIIRIGAELNVDYSMTISCYRATEDGKACGTCDSCMYRKQGFLETGLKDNTRYA